MIDFAFADTAAVAQETAPAWMQYGPLVLIMVVAYFLLLAPAKKQQKAAVKMLNELEKGDEVVLANGIAGRITKVGEKFLTVEIGKDTEIKMERRPGIISTKLEKGSLKDL
ncbi:preprotein translocase subunit YajC [Neisseria sp. Ec49-e6-T10]|uniref:preprotein translocase subunit YajC n=1 Tax=Neisseria sp. Ec49-e6-T10 TaxID=3140744 RepID=UPI003EBBC4C8